MACAKKSSAADGAGFGNLGRVRFGARGTSFVAERLCQILKDWLFELLKDWIFELVGQRGALGEAQGALQGEPKTEF